MPRSAFRVSATGIACLALTLAGEAADLKLPAVISDGMVLQRETSVPLWGWAKPGDSVQVRPSWTQQGLTAITDQTGRWLVRLATPPAGGPFTITISGDRDVTIQDVLVGEVWVCSGQSNMEMTLGPKYFSVENWQAEVAAADFPEIRLFDVPNVVSAGPLSDCQGKWTRCTPETAKDFGSVAYYFARELHRTLHVPIGLLESDWGGTPIEAWMSATALGSFPEYADSLASVARMRDSAEAAQRERAEAFAKWCQQVDAADPGSHDATHPWHAPDCDDSAWESTELPRPWTGAAGPLANFHGIVWYRLRVELPTDWVGAKATLELGPIDDCDVTWVNGTPIGQSMEENVFQKPRSYRLPAGVLKPGPNVIAVRALDTGGVGGFTGKPEQMRLRRDAEDADQPGIPLAGPWKYKPGAALKDLPRRPNVGTITAHTPTALFNGMIAPILPYGLRGGIWYQGESNRANAARYPALFAALVADWRTQWASGEFPFYYVQIAPFRYGDLIGRAADIREAQRRCLAVANTGMAVTTDIGDLGNIHPKNKADVGKRLALWALAKTYGQQDIVYSGPLYKSMKIEGERIRLFFDHATGLTSHDKPLAGFEIAGAEHEFVEASAAIDNGTIVVSSPKVPKPVAARFGWSDTAEASLWNAAGLPASPFCTEEWPPRTK